MNGVLRHFQQYFSHIMATAHIIHVFPGIWYKGNLINTHLVVQGQLSRSDKVTLFKKMCFFLGGGGRKEGNIGVSQTQLVLNLYLAILTLNNLNIIGKKEKIMESCPLQMLPIPPNTEIIIYLLIWNILFGFYIEFDAGKCSQIGPLPNFVDFEHQPWKEAF